MHKYIHINVYVYAYMQASKQLVRHIESKRLMQTTYICQ